MGGEFRVANVTEVKVGAHGTLPPCSHYWTHLAPTANSVAAQMENYESNLQ